MGTCLLEPIEVVESASRKSARHCPIRVGMVARQVAIDPDLKCAESRSDKMALIENLSTELRSWFFPVLRQLGDKAERHDPDPPSTAGALTISLPIEIRDELEAEADKRGVTVAELCGSLLCVTTEHGLVGAVLGDTLA